MQLTLVFIVALMLGTSPINAQSTSIISNAAEKLTELLGNLQNELVSAMRGTIAMADSFVDDVSDTINNLQHSVQSAIDDLRKEYAGPIYDPCFPARMPITFAEHYIGGIQSCINKTIQAPINSAKTLLEEIDKTIVTVNEIPTQIQNCKGNAMCLLKLTSQVTVSLPISVGKISISVGKTVALLATFHDRIVPCGFIEGEFLDWAMNSVGNITTCIENIAKIVS